MAKIKNLVVNGRKVQVESAIRDGLGNNIANTYATSSNLSGVSGRVTDIEAKIPSAATSSNQLADKAFVNSTINSSAAFFRGNYATKAALLAVAWQTSDPTASYYVSNNDYAYVEADESNNNEAWRYIYVEGTGWKEQFKVNNTPFTQAQLDALNSGITATLVSNIQTNNAKVSNVQADWNATTGLAVILNKPTIPTVPTNISAFTNDSGYLTSSTGVTSVNGNVGAITNIATTSDIPTDNASLTNGAGYITSSDIPLTDVKVNNVSVVSSKVASITVPTKVSDLTNDSGFITSYNNQRVKAKNSSNTDVTFGANDVVEIKAGDNIVITPDSTNKTITIAGASSTPTVVKINNESITNNSVANIVTESAYNSSTNKIATMNDIPSLTNYVTTNTTQTISGTKTFNAPTNVASTEQTSMKINTSNGGSITFGKDGASSGTMIRLDQTDGTARLKFRSSATAGAMVWEQPEQGAQLYIDLGKESVDKHRITFPTTAGTLALTSQIPSVPVTDVQLNGTSVLSSGVANIKAMPNFNLSLSTSSGGTQAIKFITVDYTSATSEAGVLIKLSMVSGHGNGSSYTFLQDAILSVSYQGTVSAKMYKYYGATTTYSSTSCQFGDIFWTIDTTNKVVVFYTIAGQYSTVKMTPYMRLNSSSGGTITQHTGTATKYSSGTINWGTGGNLALVSDIPTSIDGLSGGQLTSPLVIKGGDAATASKIALDQTASGQITNNSTATIFGFTSNNATTLTVGHSSYALALRGSGTRPKFNSNDLALYSDIPTVPDVSTLVSNVSYDSSSKKLQQTKNGTTTDIATFGSNAFTNTTIPTSYVSSSSYNSSNRTLTITPNSGTATTVTFGSNAFNSTTIPSSKTGAHTSVVYGTQNNGCCSISTSGTNITGQVASAADDRLICFSISAYSSSSVGMDIYVQISGTNIGGNTSPSSGTPGSSGAAIAQVQLSTNARHNTKTLCFLCPAGTAWTMYAKSSSSINISWWYSVYKLSKTQVYYS